MNNKLLDIPSIVRAISSVGYDEVSFPAFVEDKEIKKYAYIVLPRKIWDSSNSHPESFQKRKDSFVRFGEIFVQTAS